MDDLNGLDIIDYLINKLVLDIDPSRTGPGKISNQSFIRGMGQIGIFSENVEKPARLAVLNRRVTASLHLFWLAW